jgi:hypothetical protein
MMAAAAAGGPHQVNTDDFFTKKRLTVNEKTVNSKNILFPTLNSDKECKKPLYYW